LKFISTENLCPLILRKINRRQKLSNNCSLPPPLSLGRLEVFSPFSLGSFDIWYDAKLIYIFAHSLITDATLLSVISYQFAWPQNKHHQTFEIRGGNMGYDFLPSRSKFSYTSLSCYCSHLVNKVDKYQHLPVTPPSSLSLKF